ncbi:MAG: PIN domain-containing protein [Thermoplasmata archaeon]|nr:PIN domain-containing protein [Thermoplasmata archaeon]
MREDAYHDAAIATFTEIVQGTSPFRFLYTSNYIVDEVLTFLLYEAGSRVALEMLTLLRSSPTLRFLRVTEDVEEKADRLFRRFAGSRVSYTDCTTKALMDRESIRAAFSFDRDLEILGAERIP